MKNIFLFQSKFNGTLTRCYYCVNILFNILNNAKKANNSFVLAICATVFLGCKTESPVNPPVINQIKLVEGEIKESNVTIDVSKIVSSVQISGDWKSAIFTIDRIVLDGKVQPVIKSIDFVGDESVLNKNLEELRFEGWESSIGTMLTYLGSNLGLKSEEVSKLSANKFDSQYAEPWKLTTSKASVFNAKISFFNNGNVYFLPLNVNDDGKFISFYNGLKPAKDTFINDKNIMDNCFNKFTLANGTVYYSPKNGTGVNFSCTMGGRSFTGVGFSKSVIGTINDINKL